VIVGFAMSYSPTEAVYIPTEHRYIGAPLQLKTEQVLERLRPLLEGEDRKIVCQNVKYETIVLARYGVTLSAVEYDTMLMSYLLDPGRLSQGLDALAKDYLSHEMVRYKNVAGSSRHAVDFDLVDLDVATGYAAEDADATLALCEVLEPALEQAKLRKIHDEIELPLVGVLARMEQTGVCIDTGILHELSREFERELTALQRQIDESAGQRLNPNSPQQLREVLFERLKLPVKKQTKSGASTDQSVLEELAELHELPDLILQFRSFSKLKGTYVDSLPGLRHAETGRIHTDFNQAVTATGRLSSSNPNLQNIPVRSARGREIRRAFVPQEGWKLIVADYSQIELRLMAHLSGDPKLVNAYKNGEDIHRLTASEVFDLPLDEVTDERRAEAKTINFGVMYGMGAARLAASLKIRQPQAREYIANYFQRYEGVSEYFHRLRADARATGYSETMFGRRRLMDDLFGGTRAQQSFAERVAVNMPIQGSSADIIKLAMIELDAEIRRRELPMHMLMQVHDELVFECAEDVVEEASALVRDRMEGVVELVVPLEVDLGVGANWFEAK
jgi:DNA polymerase-1